MKLFHCSPSKLSIFCASSAVPSVQVTSACVSPRVKTEDPCVRGSTLVSIQIARTSSNLRPSSRTPCVSTSSRRTFSFKSLKICFASSLRSTSPSGIDARSEEHTSELQSQSNLVCRLLLEKKKTKYRRARLLPGPDTEAPPAYVLFTRTIPTRTPHSHSTYGVSCRHASQPSAIATPSTCPWKTH